LKPDIFGCYTKKLTVKVPYYKNVTEAVNNMVKIDLKVEPDDSLTTKYRSGYEEFVEELRKRKGIIYNL